MGCVKSKPKLTRDSPESKKKVIPITSQKYGESTVTVYDNEGKGKNKKIWGHGSKDSADVGNMSVSIIPSDRGEIESIYAGVHDGQVLGYGIGGLVRLVTHRETGTKFALKTLSLDQISEKGLKQVQEEVRILMELDHPNIVKLDMVYQTDEEIYMFQELCRGGDLFDRLDAQPEEHYGEAQCARLIKQILAAVRYIHSKGIIHRDLKLENFLFDVEGPNAELKMIDFGLSKHFQLGETHHEPVGTRYTVAPEVLHGEYDEKVDIWAIGVITYLLLSGDAPFGGCCEDESATDVRKSILSANFSFQPEENWKHVSQQAKDFISMLLVEDSSKRPAAEECQSSEWLREWTENGKQESKPLNSNVIQALRAFRDFSDMRKLLCEVIGFTLLPDQISLLRKEFEKLDVEGKGEISLHDLKRVLISNAGSSVISNFVETEVEDIFNALRLHSSTTIHWHHFLAASLSQSPVDGRNHKLAFDKIDVERKGYITFEDIMKICPIDLKQKTNSMQSQWRKSIKRCRATSKVQYEDFVNMMEGDDVSIL